MTSTPSEHAFADKSTSSDDNFIKIQYIDIANLRFDPENPRLPTSVDGFNEQSVLAYLLKDATLVELMGSVGTQDYFAGEPLLVCEAEDEPGVFLVVEGNRRFASVKLLSFPEIAPTNKPSVLRASTEATYKPKSLPAVIYPNRNSILGYLSYRHITGVKAWSPLQKARYLAQLRLTYLDLSIPEQFRILAKSIGTKSDYVARLLTGNSIYNKIVDNNFFEIPRLSEDTFDFSVLTTALNYSNIQKFVGIETNDDPEIPDVRVDHLNELVSWMFEKNSENITRLGESRNLKFLNSVVGNEKALVAFRNGTPLSDAKDLTNAPAELFRNTLSQSRDKLSVARDILHLVEKPTSADEEDLRGMILVARDMRSVVISKLTESEELGL